MYFLLHCINWEKSKDLIRSTYIDIRLKKTHRGWLFIPFPIIVHILYTGKYSPPFSPLPPPPPFALVVSGQI